MAHVLWQRYGLSVRNTSLVVHSSATWIENQFLLLKNQKANSLSLLFVFILHLHDAQRDNAIKHIKWIKTFNKNMILRLKENSSDALMTAIIKNILSARFYRGAILQRKVAKIFAFLWGHVSQNSYLNRWSYICFLVELIFILGVWTVGSAIRQLWYE